jgi:hypothetical protein
MAYNLSNLYISQSFQQLLQVSASNVIDGTGSLLTTLYINNDKVVTQTTIDNISAVTSSIDALNTFTGSAVYRSGSFTGSFTGSFLGTIISASYAFTASSAISSSFSSFAVTSSRSLSSFNSDTASYVANAVSASYAFTASSAISSSISVTSSHAITASYALNAPGSGTGFPFSGSAQITGSLGITGSLRATSITSSLFGTSSWAVSASQAVTASNAVSASYATYALQAGTVVLSGQIAASGSPVGIPQSPLSLFAGAGQTIGSSPASLVVNIQGLIGKTLGTNAFISTTLTGSFASTLNEFIAVEKLESNGNITFISQAPIRFTFTGIYF